MAVYTEITKIKANPKNPRVIADKDFRKLIKSINDFPQMLEKRPLVCVTDPSDGMIYPLGGNQRLKACRQAGLTSVPIEMADEWNEAQRREFAIKDNVGSGEWNWEDLKTDWNVKDLENWGLSLPNKLEKRIIADEKKPWSVTISTESKTEAKKLQKRLSSEGFTVKIFEE